MIKKLTKAPKIWLTLADSRHLYENFRKRLDLDEPIPPFETRFPGNLEGILASVKQTFNRHLLNPTLLDGTAAYLNQVIRGHPFKNGNKRMAILFSHSFLLMHGVDFTLHYNELFHFATFVAIAGTRNITPDETKKWCKEVLAEFTKEMNSKI